jgi:hypothetical protein
MRRDHEAIQGDAGAVSPRAGQMEKYEDTYATCSTDLSRLGKQEERSINVIRHKREMHSLLQIRYNKAKAAFAALK